MNKLISLLTVVLCLAACGPSAGDVIEEHRNAAEKRLAEVEEFAQRVEDGDTPSSDLAPPDGVKFVFPHPDADDFGNAVCLHINDALGRNERDKLGLPSSSTWISLPRQYVKGDRRSDGVEKTRNFLERFLDVRFLAVIKITSLIEPFAGMDKSFTAGRIVFEVHVRDLKEGKDLGIIKGRATNDEEVIVNTETGHATKESLLRDLGRQARLALNDAITPHCEDKRTP